MTVRVSKGCWGRSAQGEVSPRCFFFPLQRGRNTIADHIRNTLRRGVSGFHHLWRKELDDHVLGGSFVFGVAVWNTKSRLFIERQRPQVFCSAQRAQWEMEVRFKDVVVSGERRAQSINDNSLLLHKST